MSEREASAMKIVYRFMWISAGAALIPIPVMDVTVLAGVHVALIKEISEHYGVEFSQNAARNILIAILASLIPGSAGSIMGRKVLRMLPLATYFLGVLSMSAFSAAVSYGLGRVFIRHFESGGTLFDFDVEHLHRLFKEHYQNGKRMLASPTSTPAPVDAPGALG